MGCDAIILEETIEPVVVGAGLRLHAHCAVGHKAGLEKTRFKKKKNKPSGVFCFFLFFFIFFYIFALERKFLGFFQFQEYF